VHDVRDNTYYATMHLVGPGKRRMTMDARPSDAIALALRTGARILVARKVLERAQQILVPDVPPEVAEAARLTELLENLSDEEFGKWKM
jgi:bifunctional DNase/RNase